MNKGDRINQSKRKETPTKFTNQSHRHHSDIDTTTVEESQKINEYKSISAGQLYGGVWKNSLSDIPKDTKRDQDYSKIVNPQGSYDTVYRHPSINHQHTFIPAHFENKMERVKSADASRFEIQNFSRNTISQDITMA